MRFRAGHALPRADARARVDKLLRYWSDRFGIRFAWNGDRADLWGHVFGMGVSGQVLVTDSGVEAWATDPGLLLRDRARGYLAWKVARYLNPRVPLEQVQ